MEEVAEADCVSADPDPLFTGATRTHGAPPPLEGLPPDGPATTQTRTLGDGGSGPLRLPPLHEGPGIRGAPGPRGRARSRSLCPQERRLSTGTGRAGIR